MNEKEKNLILKIKRLSDGRIDGEKVNAKSQLEKLMKKLNITDAELEINERIEHYFKLKQDKYLNKLFLAILQNMFNLKVEKLKGFKIDKNNWCVFLTPEEAIELQARYEFYCNSFIQDIEIFYKAFIAQNELWSKGVFVSIEELSKEELELRKKANLMSYGLDRHFFKKQLEYK